MNSGPPFKVLFLCTGNSARSIFGEFILRDLANGKFESYSAGSDPAGQVHPMTIQTLQKKLKIDSTGATSESYDTFVDQGIEFDFVITVCDRAKENCPIWPGQPVVCHWSSPDPAAFEGSDEETEKYFFSIAMLLKRRIELFTSLPIEKLDHFRLEEAANRIAIQETM